MKQPKYYSEQSRKAYNKIANHYEDTFDGQFTKEFKDLLATEAIIHNGDTVLDVACGTGALLSRFSQLYQINGYGIDIAENMIKEAASRYSDIHFQVSDCTSTPFAHGTFNCITVCAAFHHFPNPAAFLSEAARILAKDGRIYIAEVYWPPVFRQFFNLFLPMYQSGDVKVYSPREMLCLLRSANFIDIKLMKKGHIQLISARIK